MFDIKVITQPVFFEGEISHIIKLFEQGLMCLHLRKPEASRHEMLAFIKSIPQEFHSRISIHSHYDLVYDWNLRGIHCTNKGYNDFSAITKNNIAKSISTHSFIEIEGLDKDFEYTFLSPIFNSISKSGYNSSIKTESLKLFLKREHKTAIIALGGICEDTIADCNALGFDGVAVLGCIWQKGNPIEAYKRLQSLCDNF